MECPVNSVPSNEPSLKDGPASPPSERPPSLLAMLERQTESLDRLTQAIASLVKQNADLLTMVIEIQDPDPEAEATVDLSGKPIVRR